MDTTTSQKPGFLRRFFAENFIDLHGLPVSLKILTIGGYVIVFGLLFFTLLVELAGDHLSVVHYTVTEENVKLPLSVMAVTSLAFILGWAYLSTGAAAAAPRIFLPVLALFALQLFLVTGGNLLLIFLEMFFFAAVLAIYGLTFRTRFWRDFPGLYFFGWLAAVSVIVILAVGIMSTNAQVAVALSGNFSIVLILTLMFWVVLGFSVIDLGIQIGRAFTQVALRYLPFSSLSAFIVFVLLIHPALISLVFWQVRDGFLLLDLLFSLLFIIGALTLWFTHRWSAITSAVLLTLSLASPVVVLGLSMAFAGKDFTELLLDMTGIFPPILLFVGLTTYNLFGMGVAFTGADGYILPKRARVLLYFGTLILVVATMLFLSNERKVETNQLFVEIQPLINGLLALSALVLGIPYVIWMILKRRESLTGPEFLGSPRWTWLERMSGKGWFALSIILACSCSCLLTGILFWLAQPKK
jgi:hypothetical protein